MLEVAESEAVGSEAVLAEAAALRERAREMVAEYEAAEYDSVAELDAARAAADALWDRAEALEVSQMTPAERARHERVRAIEANLWSPAQRARWGLCLTSFGEANASDRPLPPSLGARRINSSDQQ